MGEQYVVTGLKREDLDDFLQYVVSIRPASLIDKISARFIKGDAEAITTLLGFYGFTVRPVSEQRLTEEERIFLRDLEQYLPTIRFAQSDKTMVEEYREVLTKLRSPASDEVVLRLESMADIRLIREIIDDYMKLSKISDSFPYTTIGCCLSETITTADVIALAAQLKEKE